MQGRIDRTRWTAANVKTTIEIVMLVVMVWAVVVSMLANHTARQANELARAALRRQNVPWLRAYNFELATTDDSRGKVTFRLANFSDSPALIVSMEFFFNFEEAGNTIPLFDNMMIPPNANQPVTVKLTRRLSPEELKAVASQMAQTPYVFVTVYSDVSGNRYRLRQEGIVGAEGHVRDYKVEGLESGAWRESGK